MVSPNYLATHYLEQLDLSVRRNEPLVAPLTASFAVTTRCNSRCNYCKIWELEDYSAPLPDLKQTVDELHDLGVYLISLSGGEPFLYDGLAELVAHIRSRKMLVSLTTNGTMLKSEKHLVPILEAGLNGLGVSLDTIDPATYAAIRGIPLKPVLDGLFGLPMQALRAQFPRLAVSINSVLSRLNVDQVLPLVEYCSERDVQVGFQPLHLTYASNVEAAALMFNEQDLPRLSSLIEKLLVMQQQGYLINNAPSYLEGFPEFLVYRQLPQDFICTAGFTTISIDHMLNVRNCWPMDPVGNLRQQPLKEMWHSEEYLERRAAMLKLECPKCWQRCHIERDSDQWLGEFFNWIASEKNRA